MRHRLVTYPPPERVLLSGAGARLWPEAMSHQGAVHLKLKWDSQCGFWLVTPAFRSLELLREGLLATEGIETGDAPVSRALWEYLERIGAAVRVESER